MKKRFFSTAGRMVVLAGCIGLFTVGNALAAHLPVPAGSNAAPRSANAPVYALVELSSAPTAAHFAQALNRAATVQSANASAVSQLSAVRSEQASFARAIAAAKLPVVEIYRLQRIFNGILYRVPGNQVDALKALAGVKSVHIVTPKTVDNARTIPFINIPALWTNLGLPVHGEGIRVGVIDTGIDYTHANFGGPGTAAAFQAVDPNVATPGVFPTAKVVGGFDFAGPIYDASSAETRKNTPQPDANPIDRSGHGSHVAGTIAGFGVKPDGTTYGQVAGENYDQSFPPSTFRIGPGAAPKALLYALKVFGDGGGSTNVDALALEWATDPNGDGDFSDHLDVVNLSLGSDFGPANSPDATFFTNAVNAGVAVVAAAGNAAAANGVGNVYFITGSPASTPEVISVAATSVGFYGSAVQINAPAGVAGLKAANGSDPQIPATNLTSDLVASAPPDACAALTNAGAVAGHIAFVARGTCTFAVKVANAQAAGATGVVIFNNAANGDTLVTMALAGTETIPARIIGRTDGVAIGTALAAGTVNATMDDSFTATRPAEADQITSFTSRGPSRIKAQTILKPDVAAPGLNIVSTAMGTGNEGIAFSGTSMATPLTAGTVALLRQLHPAWGPSDIKALLMNTATHETFNLPAGATGRLAISPTREGAGRIDAANALGSNVIAFDGANPGRVSVSFATREISAPATEVRTITLANGGAAPVTYDVTVQPAVANAGATVSAGATSVVVPAGGTANVTLTLSADPAALVLSADPTVAPTASGLPRSLLSETSGWVVFTDHAGVASTLRVPYLATLSPASTMGNSGRILIHGSPAGTATLSPQGPQAGSFALPMELAFAGQQAGVDDNDLARLKYVGVTSNLPDAGSIANGAEIFFGVSAFGFWGTPAEVAFQVMIKSAGAPSWEFALVNVQPATDVNFTELFSLDPTGNATPLFLEDLLNGLDASQPVPVFLADTMVLPVFAGDIGLTNGAGAIDYQVQTFSQAGFVDATPVLHYDLFRPAFSTNIDATLTAVTTAPYVPDVAGTTVPVTFDTTAQNGANGMLVLHMSNATGARAEAIAVAHPRQLTVSRPIGGGATCPTGGVEVTTFWDDDNDGQLTAADTIASVNDLCNGARGPAGPEGPPGPKGNSGCASAGGDASILALIGLLGLAARRRRKATA